jgi:hypothetical protein
MERRSHEGYVRGGVVDERHGSERRRRKVVDGRGTRRN